MIKHFLPFISLDESEDFALWAFGPEFMNYKYPKQFKTAWNEQHANKLFLLDDSLISQDAPQMVLLWRENTIKNIRENQDS